MTSSTSLIKRLLVGRPFRSDRLHHTLLPKRIALPVFASDPLSSVAYAPEQIFLVLSIAGLGAYSYGPWMGVFVAVVMIAVVASYRQNVRAYQSGGGDYEVANVNHGPRFGLIVASALLVDYVLTVAVSISAAAANVGSAVPFVEHHRVLFSVVAIGLLTAINLRGVKESGTAFAIPTYAFVIGILGMVGYGFFRIYVLGHSLQAESAQFELRAEEAHLAGLAFVFLLLRTFSSGCAALTGVEAIANGVPAFKPPKGKNAATTLLMMGLISITMFLGLLMLGRAMNVKLAEDPSRQLIDAPDDYI
ncbi:MAG: APC family permease, partial [Micromonosporaceae bacterium]